MTESLAGFHHLRERSAISSITLDSGTSESRTTDEEHGMSNLELLAISLQGQKKRPVSQACRRQHMQLAASSLEKAASLRELIVQFTSLRAARELLRRALEEELRQGEVFRHPAELEQFLKLWLTDRTVECFAVLFLNTQHRLIRAEELFRGTVNQTAVYPREIARRALALNAVAVILVHNHPSGAPEASHSDRQLTEAIRRALSLLDIKLLDHMIVASKHCVSFAQHGWL